MSKVLFTGATGLLGKYFFLQKPSNFDLYGTYIKNLKVDNANLFTLDVSSEDDVNALFEKIMPDFVVHAAALGNVDYCETHRDEARNVNVIGTQNVLNASKKINAKLIFTSSNAVYDGENPPYSEEAPEHPLDYYGKTKLEGEDLVRKSEVPYVILRLMTMYGWPPEGGRSNPVSWVINELRNKKEVNIVNDIFNNHLFAGQAAEVIWKLIENDKFNKTYNLAGGEVVSRLDLALETAQVFNLDKSLINSVSSDFFKNIVPRPKNTSFDISKIEEELGVRLYTVREGLLKMKDEE